VPFHFDDFTTPLAPGAQVPDLPLLHKDLFLKQLACHAPQARVIWPKVNQVMRF